MARAPVWNKVVRNWDELPAILTPEKVSQILELSLDTVRKYLLKGIIPGIKIGGFWRTDKEALRKLIENKSEEEAV